MRRVLIVDDDPLVRRSLKLLVDGEPDMEVAGVAADGPEAVELVRDRRPGIVLMDIRMPDGDGITATRSIKHEFPGTKVVMLTTFNDEPEIRAALDAGADGYLLKSGDSSSVVEQLRALYSGSAVMHSDVLRELTHPSHGELDALTSGEHELVERVAQGYSNREIASQLFLSERTVRNNISIIFDKLQLRDRTQIAIYYWRRA